VIAIGFPLTSFLLYNKIGDPAAVAGMTEREVAQGPPPMVLKAIERARSEPQNFDAQLQAAELYYEIQRYDEQPDNIAVLEAYCLVLLHEGDRTDAERTLARLAAIDPNNPDLPRLRSALNNPKP
jgi:Flp pilus assembly protein TadD